MGEREKEREREREREREVSLRKPLQGKATERKGDRIRTEDRWGDKEGHVTDRGTEGQRDGCTER